MRCSLWVASCLAWSAVVPLMGALPGRLYTAEDYDVSLAADLANQRLSGEMTIRLHSQADTAISALELDSGAGLRITSVTEAKDPQQFDVNHGKLFIVLTKPLRLDEPRVITVRYQAGPSAGLKFSPDQIYTSNTSDWMPCSNYPGERATLHLTIAAPPGLKTAASGELTATRVNNGQDVTEWRLNSPTEPFRFGFALGNFAEVQSKADGVGLCILSGAAIPAGAQILPSTAAAMRDLAASAGKPYPGQTYTQVFIHGDTSRSLAGGLTLLPESYAQALTRSPEDLWLLADGMAHQWYGVAIGVKSWSDLWVSEGVSAFLADVFLGQRFGDDRFEHGIERARQIYSRLRAEGQDRPLSDSGWRTLEEADGDIPEYKGASFFYLVDQLLGDSAFREGLQLYTGNEWGKAAASEDLQKAFDAVNTGARKAGNNKKNNTKALDNLFGTWVYGISDTKSK